MTDASYTFSIVDIHGKTVLSQHFDATSLIETINVSALSSGVYLGVLETASQRISKKIVIE